jgi:hypothetical protein
MVQGRIITRVFVFFLIEVAAGAAILSYVTCVTLGATLLAVLATYFGIRSHLLCRYNIELTRWALVNALVVELRENEFPVQGVFLGVAIVASGGPCGACFALRVALVTVAFSFEVAL